MGTLTCNNTILFTPWIAVPTTSYYIISHICALRSAGVAGEYYFYEITKSGETVWGYSLANNASTLRNYCYNSQTGGGNTLVLAPGEQIRAGFYSGVVGGTANFTMRYYEVKT